MATMRKNGRSLKQVYFIKKIFAVFCAKLFLKLLERGCKFVYITNLDSEFIPDKIKF